ncbi:LysE family transporter [Azospirillum griseum]|uniref:LysE family translocator n=1 Tax=Azospirillum griseum TaxID=2496639 RepID=A0A3S0IGG0_9PROT|nr:LysE family transporter [Azospirillum griseum]RTR21945.1 LysE family translocator [Azospirillum griseum]
MTELFTVITITLLAVISPGPDFAMVSRNSLLLSRRAGLLTALGIGGGVLVHVAYTLMGIGLVIQNSILLFNGLKLVGAAYLIWLGLRMLMQTPAEATESTTPAALSDGQALRVGFLTNALNPKTTVFIVSLFLQVVEPTTGWAVQIGYGLFIAAAHILWFALVALVLSADGVRQRVLMIRPWIDRSFGALLVGFGVTLGVSGLSK